MGRRKREASLVEEMMTGPWQLAATLCGVALFAALVVVPNVGGRSMLLKALAPVAIDFLLLFAVLCGVIAAIRFVVTRTETAASAEPQSPVFNSSARRRVTPDTAAAPRYQEFVPPIRTEPYIAPAKPDQWSLELLQSLDWKRFEEVVAAYFREKNFRSETLAYGPDGGVDARLFFGDLEKPVGIVQCKAWGKRMVGVAPVRELLGVMTHERVARGYFAATGDFTEEAKTFAKANPIMLITGQDFLVAIAKMDKATSDRLLAVSTEGEYTVPTCASCGDKLYKKTLKAGTAWVCRRYPSCRTRIWTKAA